MQLTSKHFVKQGYCHTNFNNMIMPSSLELLTNMKPFNFQIKEIQS